MQSWKHHYHEDAICKAEREILQRPMDKWTHADLLGVSIEQANRLPQPKTKVDTIKNWVWQVVAAMVELTYVMKPFVLEDYIV